MTRLEVVNLIATRLFQLWLALAFGILCSVSIAIAVEWRRMDREDDLDREIAELLDEALRG